ncbi:MAG: O-antigen ligase family protein [Planctomycetes bacterium]|nr:O-antigen ligase family protein [Planctomycetota bacterium]
MPLKTILFLLGFVGAAGGALFIPIMGVLGYVALYNLGAERQWWFAPIRGLGLDLRCSLTLAVATGIGMVLHWRSLRYGKPFLHSQEKLLLVFLGLIWLSTFVGEPTEGAYTLVDHPSVKMTKVVIFALMLTHIVTTVRRLDLLLWVLTAGSLVLGLQAYWTPYSEFTRGRIETVGGPDFTEANFLAAYLAAMLPVIGIQFLRTGWPGRLLCLFAGVFTTNAIILTRSRSSLVGVLAGMLLAVILAPKQYRKVVIAGLIVAVAGGLYLMDPGFQERATTITASADERDASAASRLVLADAALNMLKDHPLGIGAGNFFQTIGRYNPSLELKDVHNTFLRCATELGVHGLLVFVALIANAAWSLRRTMKAAAGLPDDRRRDATLAAYGLFISVVTYLGCCFTITLIYVEALWWLLALPVCMERAVANLKADALLVPDAKTTRPAKVKVGVAPALEGKRI